MRGFNKRLLLPVLLLLIALPVIILASKKSQEIRSRASAPSAPVSPPPQPTKNFSCNIKNPDGSKNYEACLHDQFNVTLAGTTPETMAQATQSAQLFYSYLKIPLAYPHYLQMFKSVGLNILVSPKQIGEGNVQNAWAYADTNGKTFTLFQAFWTGSTGKTTTSASYQEYIIIHESAHVVANGSEFMADQTQNSGYQLEKQLYSSVHDASLDPSCFKNDFLSTYPQGIVDAEKDITERRQIHETFAESLADTILCNSTGLCKSNGNGGSSVSNFPQTCANTYRFITQSVLNFPSPTCIASDISPQTAGSAPLTVNLTGNGKAGSPDNPILGYQWDFNGDGNWDTSTQSAKRQVFTYQTPETYRPTYRIFGANNTVSPICDYANSIIVSASVTGAPAEEPSLTPTQGSTVLHFPSIKLHGIGSGGDNTNPNIPGNQNPLTKTHALSAEIYNSSGNLVFVSQGNIAYNPTTKDFSGNLSLPPSISSGSYLIKVKSDRFLKRQLTGVITINKDAVNQMPSVSLVSGDANGDGKLSILDYDLINDCFSGLLPTKNCDSSKKSKTDISDDGKVDQDDYSLFLRELSVETGD